MWQYQRHAVVEAGYRAIAFDRRGHGRSTPAARGFDLDTLADDLGRVLDALDLKSAVLVGHSLGCAEIIRYLARRGSGRVAKLALLAPLTPVLARRDDNPEGAAPECFEALEAAWRTDFPAWAERNKRPFFTPDTSEALMNWLLGELLQTPLDVAIATNRAVVAEDLRPDLRRIDRPTLVIHGTADASAPLPLGEQTAAGIPGARLVVYEGAPHGLFLTHASKLNHELLAFAATREGVER